MYQGLKHLFPLSFILFIFIFLPSKALAATLSFSPSSGVLGLGCSYSFDIILDTQGVKVDGVDAVLFYDPSNLQIALADITNGKIFPEYSGNFVDQVNGKINISAVAVQNKPYSGRGNLASLRFNVLSTATQSSALVKFDFDPLNTKKTSDSNVIANVALEDVLNNVGNGSFGLDSLTPCGSKPALTSNSGSPVVPSTQTLPESGITLPTYILISIGLVFILLGGLIHLLRKKVYET